MFSSLSTGSLRVVQCYHLFIPYFFLFLVYLVSYPFTNCDNHIKYFKIGDRLKLTSRQMEVVRGPLTHFARQTSLRPFINRRLVEIALRIALRMTTLFNASFYQDIKSSATLFISDNISASSLILQTSFQG